MARAHQPPRDACPSKPAGRRWKPALSRLTYRGHLALPKQVRDAVGLRNGDLARIEVIGDRVVLTPKVRIDKSQAWFWTPEWQKKEREADEALRRGRYKTFKNVEDLIKDLRS